MYDFIRMEPKALVSAYVEDHEALTDQEVEEIESNIRTRKQEVLVYLETYDWSSRKESIDLQKLVR